MFYTLYCKDKSYLFVFDHVGVTAAKIILTNPLCDDQTIEIEKGPEWNKMTDQDREGLFELAASSQRLCREAMTMQREYMQGASGFLPMHDHMGQMLFGMDVDEWEQI